MTTAVQAQTAATDGSPEADAIRPFHIDVSGDDLDDLRRRITMARWPSSELVADASQGVQLATLQALAQYWGTDYDMRRIESRLNALPQFVTQLDGVDIHFIHARSAHANALPLLITHGWPGSVIELLEVVDPLTNPTANGGSAADAFNVVIPSLPGYGFSAQPTSLGWHPGRVAQAWATLMNRLGYTRFVAQGGDVGAAVTDAMARLAPNGLLGIHLNFLRTPPLDIAKALQGGAPAPAGLTDEEQAAFNAFARQARKGYVAENGQAPQTIGYSLTDSPVGLAAWMLDHDADSYDKIAHALLDGTPAGDLTRERIVDNITLYWLTNSAASAARLYWESGHVPASPPVPVSLPVGFTVFPGEIFQAPRSWVENVYPNLTYFNQVERGGHFAAWEEPELFSSELRIAFRTLR